MSKGRSITRKEFLRGIFHRRDESKRDARSEHSEADYLAMLPPEFSGSMLEIEAARLGGSTKELTRNEMAALIVHAMYGEMNPMEEGQQRLGAAQEKSTRP